jgi:TonB-dependent SusC/RagA subfamily outer membrane receptor
MKTAHALKGFVVAALGVVLGANAASAQAVTVSGHVTAEGRPLEGASVRIESLNIERRTDRAGYYNFLVPSVRVTGQTVKLTAASTDRRSPYAPQSVDITLNGTAIVRDFDLRPAAVAPSAAPEMVVVPGRASTVSDTGVVAADTLGLGSLSGATDIPTALAARYSSLSVLASPALGGSSVMSYRGIRSFLGSAQPLFVVDGIIQDNTTFSSLAQRYGAGGFDYGSPLQDLNARDIGTIRWLTGPDAAALYGSRAANGVVVITTANAKEGAAFSVGASEQFTRETAVRLPSFQNAYGQGLGGQFQFFDGRGHGVNDAVDQNWGPALDGRPLAQASYTQPRQADVRFWNPQAGNVDAFFRGANTTNTNVTLQTRSTLGALWLGVGQRQSDGVIPEARLRRRDARLTASAQPTSALSLSGTIAVAEMRNDDASGSGFNQTNPVSQFTRMARQVDMDSMRVHVTTADGEQISWNYAGQNNPYFAELANDNARDRNHLSGGVSARYAFDSSLTATATAGSDYYRDDRRFTIAPGWMGGFPFYASAGLFTDGGFQNDNTAAQRSNGAIRLDKTRMSGSSRWSFFGGADLATIHQRARTSGIDSVQNVPPPNDTTSTLKAPDPLSWTGHGKTFGVNAGTSVSYRRRATLGVNLRQEWVTVVGDNQASELYPSVQGSLDVAQYVPAFRFGGHVDELNLRAAWWRAGTDATPYAAQTLYAGQPLSGGVIPSGKGLLTPDASIGVETTDAWQVGLDFAALNRHVDGGVSLYREIASNVLVPRVDATSSVVANGARLRNHGVEGTLSLRGGERQHSLAWELTTTASLNYNRVEDLPDGVGSIALGPSQYGVGVEAIAGLPFGELTGYKLRRDGETGALILRDGLPQADSTATVILGQSRQNKLLGLRGTLGYRWLSLTAAADGCFGGSVFSATTYNGDVAGSLAETAFRPDSGLLIDGIDAVTGQKNTTRVTTEAYYHALGAVQEPWIYSASFFKLRELNLSFALPTRLISSLPFASAYVSLITRNVYTWSDNKNFDPEVALSVYPYPGMELGQLPTVRTIGVQLSVTP